MNASSPRQRHAARRGCAAATVAAVAALLLAGCGGGTSSGGKTRIHAGALPARAHVLFASDHAAPLAQVRSAHTTGTLEASLGFDPSVNGFSFQNYGFIAGADLDAHAMRELFGNRVCADTPSDTCTLTPAAQQFSQSISQDMFGGHCYGFSMVALRFFRHLLSPQSFGSPTTFGLSLSTALQSEVAASWATQMLPDVAQASVQAPPSTIISLLKKQMASPSSDPYTLGIFNGPPPQRAEGHAITPIGVQNLGGGHYLILVYDNNKPGTTQGIAVDTNAETWSYQVAINPSEPNAVWSGQGSSNEIFLTPLSASARLHPCPFCGARQGSHPTGFDTISLGGDPVSHGHLLITDSSGRRLGYQGGRFVNQIPGARMITPGLSEIWKARPEPLYEVPAGLRLTVALHGGPAHADLPAEVHVVGPGFGATLGNLMPGSAATDELTVLPGASSVSVRVLGAAPSALPTLAIGVNQGRGGSEVMVKPKALNAGTRLSVALPAAHSQLTVASQGGAPTRATVTVQAVGGAGTRTVQSRSVALSAGHPMSLGLLHVG